MNKECQKYYYKVTSHPKKGTYLSAIVSTPFYQKANITTQYKINEWVESPIKGSKLFVFDNTKDVANFMYFNYRFYTMQNAVFQCEVKNPKKRGPLTFVDAEYILTMWKAYRNKKKYNLDSRTSYNPPLGTVWVDAVKLIKRVYINRDGEQNE